MSGALIIPPLPDVLLSIQKLMKQEEPDIPAIATLVKEDIALYTLFLSAANSPWMGLSQPTTSIEHAIMLMGLDRIYTMVQGMTIRTAFNGCSLKESFWTTAIDVAGICSDLAHRFSGLDRNMAYSIGMLHNTGMAIMINHHTEFIGFIKNHELLSSSKLCSSERKEFGTDHYLQGALMAKEWNLGEEVVFTIRCQPIAEKILSGEKKMDENVCTYLSILMLSKSVSSEFRKYWLIDENSDQTCRECDMALDYMHINHGEFDELKEDLLDDFMTKTEKGK
jgi:HD-like signal output (HDOD) protein